MIGGDSVNHEDNYSTPRNHLFDDITLKDSTDEPMVEAVNGDTEGMDVDGDAEETEKNADLEVEEEEEKVEEEASQHDEEAQPLKMLVKESISLPTLKRKGMVTKIKDRTLTNEVENEQENEDENENEGEENEHDC